MLKIQIQIWFSAGNIAEEEESLKIIKEYENQDNIKIFNNKENIGLTAGASAPEILVEEVIKKLKIVGASIVKESPGIKESVVFSLPKELIKKAKEIA